MRCICMRDCLGYSLDLVKTGCTGYSLDLVKTGCTGYSLDLVKTGCTGNLKKFEITIKQQK